MMQIDPSDRARLLRYVAGTVPESHNAQTVVENATPIVAWVEAAADDDDLDRRISAIREQRYNLSDLSVEERAPLLLPGAKVLYHFMVANADSRESASASPSKEQR